MLLTVFEKVPGASKEAVSMLGRCYAHRMGTRTPKDMGTRYHPLTGRLK